MARADPDRQPDLLGREPTALAALSQQPPDQHRALGINAGRDRPASSPHHGLIVSGTRMKFFVHRAQPFLREMRVNLGRRDVGMSEEQLHRA